MTTISPDGRVSEYGGESSYFVDPRTSHRIYLREYDGSDNWIDIAPDLSTADEKAIAAAEWAVRSDAIRVARTAATIDPNAPAPDVTIQAAMSPDHKYVTFMLRSLRAWSFKLPGPSGQVAPINETWIRRLGPVGEWLYRRIDDYYAERKLSPAERGNSMPGSSPTTDTSRAPDSPQSAFSSSWPDGTDTEATPTT